MGALPKNKITRSERGKRRAGNTPSLTKQVKHTTVPLHKRGMVNQILQSLGLTDGTAKKTSPLKENKKADKKATTTENKAIQAKLARQVTKPAMQKGAAKQTTRRSLNKDS